MHKLILKGGIVLTQFPQQTRLQYSFVDSNQGGFLSSAVREDERVGSNSAYSHIQLAVPGLQHNSHVD